MDIIELCFDGPFSFDKKENTIFDCKYANCEGIYLWTVKQNDTDNYFIHYVGETTKFASRQKEHLVNILGLNYGIFNVDELRNGRDVRLWEGLWRKKDSNGPVELLKYYQALSGNVIEYIKGIDIFFAEIITDANQRKHIEGSIGWNLRNNHVEYSSIYPSDNHIGTKEEKEGNVLKIRASKEIKGIDERINI